MNVTKIVKHAGFYRAHYSDGGKLIISESDVKAMAERTEIKIDDSAKVSALIECARDANHAALDFKARGMPVFAETAIITRNMAMAQARAAKVAQA